MKKTLTFIFLLATLLCFQPATTSGRASTSNIVYHLGEPTPLTIVDIPDNEFGLHRKVEVWWYIHNAQENSIRVGCIVKHYNNNNELVETMALRSFERILNANQSANRMVDTDGMVLLTPTDSTYARPDNQALKGTPANQYAFFDNKVRSGPLDIIATLRSVVLMEAVVMKTFDK